MLRVTNLIKLKVLNRHISSSVNLKSSEFDSTSWENLDLDLEIKNTSQQSSLQNDKTQYFSDKNQKWRKISGKDDFIDGKIAEIIGEPKNGSNQKLTVGNEKEADLLKIGDIKNFPIQISKFRTSEYNVPRILLGNYGKFSVINDHDESLNYTDNLPLSSVFTAERNKLNILVAYKYYKHLQKCKIVGTEKKSLDSKNYPNHFFIDWSKSSTSASTTFDLRSEYSIDNKTEHFTLSQSQKQFGTFIKQVKNGQVDLASIIIYDELEKKFINLGIDYDPWDSHSSGPKLGNNFDKHRKAIETTLVQLKTLDYKRKTQSKDKVLIGKNKDLDLINYKIKNSEYLSEAELTELEVQRKKLYISIEQDTINSRQLKASKDSFVISYAYTAKYTSEKLQTSNDTVKSLARTKNEKLYGQSLSDFLKDSIYLSKIPWEDWKVYKQFCKEFPQVKNPATTIYFHPILTKNERYVADQNRLLRDERISFNYLYKSGKLSEWSSLDGHEICPLNDKSLGLFENLADNVLIYIQIVGNQIYYLKLEDNFKIVSKQIELPKNKLKPLVSKKEATLVEPFLNNTWDKSFFQSNLNLLLSENLNDRLIGRTLFTKQYLPRVVDDKISDRVPPNNSLGSAVDDGAMHGGSKNIQEIDSYLEILYAVAVCRDVFYEESSTSSSSNKPWKYIINGEKLPYVKFQNDLFFELLKNEDPSHFGKICQVNSGQISIFEENAFKKILRCGCPTVEEESDSLASKPQSEVAIFEENLLNKLKFTKDDVERLDHIDPHSQQYPKWTKTATIPRQIVHPSKDKHKFNPLGLTKEKYDEHMIDQIRNIFPVVCQHDLPNYKSLKLFDIVKPEVVDGQEIVERSKLFEGVDNEEEQKDNFVFDISKLL